MKRNESVSFIATLNLKKQVFIYFCEHSYKANTWDGGFLRNIKQFSTLVYAGSTFEWKLRQVSFIMLTSLDNEHISQFLKL